MTRFFENPFLGPLPETAHVDPEAPLAFHRKLPAYAPTRLAEAVSLSEELGLGSVLVKDESTRFGLPSFKLLGASWASYRALVERLGREVSPWATIEELAQELSELRPFTLAAATDGNHGRAVAHMARLLSFEASIFVPQGTATARIEAIESEGARCTVVDGDYDETIERSAKEASERCLVIDDTSWPGYEDIPQWVIDGYGTIFTELDAQLAGTHVDFVFVPVGVGALAAAAVAHIKRQTDAPRVIGVEPLSAAGVLASLEAGKLVTAEGAHATIMAGLNCPTPSPIAFPTLKAGLDAVVAVEDTDAEKAMRLLAKNRIVSGETGAAALAGLLALLAPEQDALREAIELRPNATVVLLSTEGATDPEAYERITGRTPESVTS